ncbi:MAG: glycosyltransferase [Leptospirales bacterium]
MIENLKQGGSERYVAELAKSASEFWVSPHVVCFSEGGIFFEEIRQAKIPLTVVPIRSLYHASALVGVFKIFLYIRKHRIKIVHSFQPNANILGTLVANLSRIPVIVSRRSLGDLGTLGTPRLEWFQRNITNPLADRFLANSKAVLSSAVLRERIPVERFSLIYNGLDTKTFAPPVDRAPFRKALGFSSDDFVFGVVAGLRQIKGVDVVIKGFSEISNRFQHAKLLIVGDGPERDQLKQLSTDSGLSDKILFLGSQRNMETIYPVMDVFVLCSHTEGFSNAILEAMGMGLPVIASRVGGNIEMVSEGENGFLVTPNVPRELGERMEFFLENRKSAFVMGKNSRVWIEQTNSQAPIHRQFADLYKSLYR